MAEATHGCVCTDGGQPCPDVVTSTIPAPICQRHRMQIAVAIVPEMLHAAACQDMRPPRELPAPMQAVIDGAGRAALRLDGAHPPCVYFLTRGDRVKIGFSANLAERLESLHAEAADVALLLVGGRPLETALHERYADFRIGTTEWFARVPCLEELISTKRRLPVAPPPSPVVPAPRGVGRPYASPRHTVDATAEELVVMLQRAYCPGDNGVPLENVVKAFREEGRPAAWSLSALGRAYEAAGVRVRPALRCRGRISIGIHRDDLPVGIRTE